VFTDGEHWYLLADDDRSGERRTFRVDRIESVDTTGVVHEVDPTVAAPTSFFDDEIPRARLLLAPGASWVVERYPVDRVEPVIDRPGWSEVTLPVASERWLARLLVRLGADAEVLEPDDHAGRDLARAMLARYEEDRQLEQR
jgi:proteasome accessory factor C